MFSVKIFAVKFFTFEIILHWNKRSIKQLHQDIQDIESIGIASKTIIYIYIYIERERERERERLKQLKEDNAINYMAWSQILVNRSYLH